MMSCPFFGYEKNCQVEHYFSANFLCRVMKRQSYSPRPSFPTFSLMLIAPLILNSGRKLRLFLNAPHN